MSLLKENSIEEPIITIGITAFHAENTIEFAVISALEQNGLGAV